MNGGLFQSHLPGRPTAFGALSSKFRKNVWKRALYAEVGIRWAGLAKTFQTARPAGASGSTLRSHGGFCRADEHSCWIKSFVAQHDRQPLPKDMPSEIGNASTNNKEQNCCANSIAVGLWIASS